VDHFLYGGGGVLRRVQSGTTFAKSRFMNPDFIGTIHPTSRSVSRAANLFKPEAFFSTGPQLRQRRDADRFSLLIDGFHYFSCACVKQSRERSERCLCEVSP